MVRGPLRIVLWTLSSLAVLWLLLALTMLPAMGRMMSGGMMGAGMSGEGGMTNGMVCCAGGMPAMMGMMTIQGVMLLGLAGIFIYLVVDSLRSRRSRTSAA